jgi:hypothetical protein
LEGLIRGKTAALKSLAEEEGVQTEFRASMEGWLKKHGRSLAISGVKP